MSRAHKWFWVVVAAQALFLLSWAGYHEYVRQHGPVLVLKGKPVDPRDILRGDYMIIGYDIDEVMLPEGAASAAEASVLAGTNVWVLLELKDRYHVVVAAAQEKLLPGPGQVLVRAERRSAWRSDKGKRSPTWVDYGIEQYYVPEGKGEPRFELMEVEVSVSPDHRLYIKQVLLDGKAFP